MKVFNKGQVVLPATMRRALGIEVGDNLEVDVDRDRCVIELHLRKTSKAHTLAGSLSRYKTKKKFPTRAEMHTALAKGLVRER